MSCAAGERVVCVSVFKCECSGVDVQTHVFKCMCSSTFVQVHLFKCMCPSVCVCSGCVRVCPNDHVLVDWRVESKSLKRRNASQSTNATFRPAPTSDGNESNGFSTTQGLHQTPLEEQQQHEVEADQVREGENPQIRCPATHPKSAHNFECPPNKRRNDE